MQQDHNSSKYLWKRAAVCVVSACVIIAFYFCIQRSTGLGELISNAWRVIQPIVMGFIMAFLMNPIMMFFERHLYGFIRKHSKTDKKAFTVTRTIASLLSLAVLIGICVFIIAMVIPELISTITYLVNNIENQIAGVLDWCNVITKGKYEETLMNAKNSEIDKSISKAVEFAQKYLNYDQDQLIAAIKSSVILIIKLIVNLIIGMFVSVYVLILKETFKGQAKKLIYGCMKAEHANVVLEICRKSNDIFYGFIIGKIIDSIIIGIICYICCLIMQMPYAVLVSVIVGVTNIIPVFGPYIGAVPTVIIIFLTEPMKGIYFLIFVLILQQFDGNWLGPKILGNSTGISSFWVVFAVVVGGGLFGVPGMIIGVPVLAIIYYLVGRYARYRLRLRDLPEDTESYVDLDHVDTQTNAIVQMTKEQKESKSSIKRKQKK